MFVSGGYDFFLKYVMLAILASVLHRTGNDRNRECPERYLWQFAFVTPLPSSSDTSGLNQTRMKCCEVNV